MYKFISVCCSIVFIISLAACSQDKPKEQASTPQITQQQPDTRTAAASGEPVTGKVLEAMDASGYTYLNVETAAGAKWIAVNQTPVEVGEEVTYMDGMVMQNFFSKALDRTFPEIVFSGGLVGKGGTPPAMPPQQGSGEGSFSQALTAESGMAAPPGAVMPTGSPDDSTHDLVVTTSVEPAADWDIITIEGILAANKDFGSGYSYLAIVEEASLK